jgi:signal transduction histidine kinase
VAAELGAAFAADLVRVAAQENGPPPVSASWSQASTRSAGVLDGLADAFPAGAGTRRVHVVADVGTCADLPPDVRARLAEADVAAVLVVRLEGGAELPTTLAVAASTRRCGRDEDVAEKNDFVSTVSHELRTPLTSIMGYVELLLDGCAGALSDRQEALLATVNQISTRLLDLIEDLPTLSRIESGTLRLQQDAIDVASLAAEVAGETAPRFAARRLRLTVETPPHAVVVRGDGSQLERVLFNLLSNAVKFTAEGGAVSVATSCQGGRAEITVTDDGMGIPAGEQARVFERFFRSSTAQERAAPGTGLGLAITRSIVERHGGTVGLRSCPGKGTTFRVRLPLDGAAA